MRFDEYQVLAMKTAVFTDQFYPKISLLIEASELVDLFVKPDLRGDTPKYDKDMITSEAGDVLWNLAACLHVIGIKLEQVACHQMPRSEAADIAFLSSNVDSGNNGNHSFYAKAHLVKSCGEFMNLFIDSDLAGQSSPNKDDVIALGSEVLVALIRLVKQYGIGLLDVATYNIKKLADRSARNVIKASGDNR